MAFKPSQLKKPQEKKHVLTPEEEKKLLDSRHLLEEEMAYRRGLTSIKDFIAPAAFYVDADHVRVGSKYARTIFVLGYPRYIQVGWFAPVINFSASFDIAINFAPLDTPLVLKQLRDKVGRVEAEITSAQEKGKPRDPAAETALRDMEKLRDDLTQGIEHFFSVGVYMTIYANTMEELGKTTEDVEAIFATKLVYTKRVYYQAEQGFNSTVPMGNDKLQISFNMNTSPAAAAFPFISSDLTSDDGILYGINRHNNSLVLFDRFSMQNANEVVFATSGAGKSVKYSTPVLIKDQEGVRMVNIGEYVDSLEKTRAFEAVDTDMEGVMFPGVKVYSFGKDLKGEWSEVSVAARKIAPEDEFVFRLSSGREMTVTGDHNMLVLRNGKVETVKSAEILEGEFVPVPTNIPEPRDTRTEVNVFELLDRCEHVYVVGVAEMLSKHYEAIHSQEIDARYDGYLRKYAAGRPIPIRYLANIFLAHPQIASENRDKLLFCSRNGVTRGNVGIRYSLTPEFMRLMGYIIAEGTISKKFIIISQEEEQIRGDIARCLNAAGIPYYVRKTGDRAFVIATRIWVDLILSLGVKGKSHEKRIPQIVYSLPNELTSEFLRGYFEGDGGVEGGRTVTATSKSKELISDLAYLCLRFGIVVRLQVRKKRATNGTAEGFYSRLSISGQEFLEQFANQIGFVSERKRASLAAALGKKENTNVWTIPVKSVVQELYDLFSCRLRGSQDIINLKNGVYQPSRAKLNEVVNHLEDAVRTFIGLRKDFALLSRLPHLASLVAVGTSSCELNGMLWGELGQSWRLMKNYEVEPRTTTVFRAIETISEEALDCDAVRQTVHRGYKELNLSFDQYSQSLRDGLCVKGDIGYQRLYDASRCVLSEYEAIFSRLPRIRELIGRLASLVRADLVWDPIVSIEKRKTSDRYVYDLTVDNEVFLAGHGGLFVHNSYAIKLEVLRSLMMGVDVIIIDPEREYQHLCEAVGGTYINISLASPSRINPFDLPRPVGEQVSAADIIRSAVITLKGLIRLMIGVLEPVEDSIMDRALIETYAKKDITADTDLTKIEPPTMSDLISILGGMEGAQALVEKMKKYTEGTFAGLLNNATNVSTDNQLMVFSVRDLEDELRPIAIYTIVNFIWSVVRSEMKKRILVIDEAWWLMQHEDSARFIFALVKRCRKYYLGVTTITQDVNDFLASEYGKAILTNSSIQLLLKQSPAAIDMVQKTFMLTEGEKYLLLESAPGEGIFFAGQKHVAIKIVASYSEDQLITTDPRQLLEIEEAKKELAAEERGSGK